MPIVDEQRIKGNRAAALVAAYLSKRCLVRPVADGTDVGVDLFCETVDNSSQEPFLHFWVQVKTGESQIGIRNKKASCSEEKDASCKLKKSHIEYWCRQPVPTYIFLVPEDSLSDFKCVYVIDITRQRSDNKISFGGNNKSKTLWSDFTLSTDNYDDFIDNTVPFDYLHMQLFSGVVKPIPAIEQGYIQEIPYKIAAGYGKEVISQVRRSVSIAMMAILDLSEPADRQEKQLVTLMNILRVFTTEIPNSYYTGEHYEDYWSMGKYYKRNNDMSNADVMFHKAISIIQQDAKFDRIKAAEYINQIECDMSNYGS